MPCAFRVEAVEPRAPAILGRAKKTRAGSHLGPEKQPLESLLFWGDHEVYVQRTRKHRRLITGVALMTAALLAACGGNQGHEDSEEEEDSGEQAPEEETTGANNGSEDSEGTSGTSGTGGETTTSSPEDGTSGEDNTPEPGPCDRGLAVTHTVSEDIKSSVTWSGVVKLTTSIRLRDGVKLTIAPGTTILADSGAEIEAGDFIDDSGIVAAGTAAAPIRFCGANDTPGFWKGIHFGKDSLAGSTLSHVSIANAGAAQEGAALRIEAPVKLEQVEISGSAGYAIIAEDFAQGSSGLTIRNCAAAVSLHSSVAVDRFPAPSVFQDNQKNAVELAFRRVESNMNLPKLGAPYLQTENLRVERKSVMTLQAGVEYQVAQGKRLEIGDYLGGAQLVSSGSEKEPVLFRGELANAGSWEGIRFLEDSSEGSSLTHTVIRHAGGERGYSLDSKRAILVDHLSIEEGMNGVRMRGEPFASGSKMLSVKNTKGYAVRIEAQALISFPVGGTFDGNERSVVWVERGEISKSGTIAKLGIPYHLEGRIRLEREVDLVIAAGTEFEMGRDASLLLDPYGDAGSVVAKGTAAEPIKFRGEKQEAGYWDSVKAGKKLKANSEFEHVEFSHGGQGYRSGMLELDRAFPVKECSFIGSKGYGIRRDRDDATDYSAQNHFKDNKAGPVGD